MSSADQILLFEGLEEAADETTQESPKEAPKEGDDGVVARFRVARSGEKKIAVGVLSAMRELVGRGLNLLHEFADPFLADEGFSVDTSRHVVLIMPAEGGELEVVVVDDPASAAEVLQTRRAAGLTP